MTTTGSAVLKRSKFERAQHGCETQIPPLFPGYSGLLRACPGENSPTSPAFSWRPISLRRRSAKAASSRDRLSRSPFSGSSSLENRRVASRVISGAPQNLARILLYIRAIPGYLGLSRTLLAPPIAGSWCRRRYLSAETANASAPDDVTRALLLPQRLH